MLAPTVPNPVQFNHAAGTVVSSSQVNSNNYGVWSEFFSLIGLLNGCGWIPSGAIASVTVTAPIAATLGTCVANSGAGVNLALSLSHGDYLDLTSTAQTKAGVLNVSSLGVATAGAVTVGTGVNPATFQQNGGNNTALIGVQGAGSNGTIYFSANGTGSAPTQSFAGNGSISVGAISGSSLNVGSGGISGGALTASSATVNGTLASGVGQNTDVFEWPLVGGQTASIYATAANPGDGNLISFGVKAVATSWQLDKAGNTLQTGSARASSNGGAVAHVPPVYTPAGADMGGTTHMVAGSISCTVAGGPCGTTVTLSGAAAFTSATSYFCSTAPRSVSGQPIVDVDSKAAGSFIVTVYAGLNGVYVADYVCVGS